MHYSAHNLRLRHLGRRLCLCSFLKLVDATTPSSLVVVSIIRFEHLLLAEEDRKECS